MCVARAPRSDNGHEGHRFVRSDRLAAVRALQRQRKQRVVPPFPGAGGATLPVESHRHRLQATTARPFSAPSMDSEFWRVDVEERVEGSRAAGTLPPIQGAW